MLWLIVRKEAVSHILSLRFGTTFALILVLIFASVYVSIGRYERAVAERGMQAAAGRRALDQMVAIQEGQRRIETFYADGRVDAVPVAPLSWLAQGLQPGYPAAFNTRIRGATSVAPGLSQSALLGLMRVPDLVYVVSVVLSLLAILFMFDSVCGEKESGTLRLLLSNPVPRHTVLLGKWLGGYGALVAPFLVAVAGGLGYAWVRGVLDPTRENCIRLLLVVVAACLYMAVFFNISLFISTVTRHATTALLVALLVWVLFILAIPNLAPVTARILRPNPPQRKVTAEKSAIDRLTRLRLQHLFLTGDLAYGADFQQQADRVKKEGDLQKREWDRYYEHATAAQLDLAGALGRVSPSACWTYAAASLANTGPDAYRRLATARRTLSRGLASFWSSLKNRRRRTRRWPQFSVDEIPRLQVAFPGLAEAVRSALNDLLILTVLNVVFFLLAFTFMLRYDVT